MTPILLSSGKRRPYRVPLGLPKGREDWRIGSVVSLAVHLGIIALLLMPLAVLDSIREIEQGAGGPGPAGGGGGGWRANQPELLRFVRVAPAPPSVPTPQANVPPPTPAPTPPPDLEALKLPQPALTGGTGTDNSAGSGPGSGGGVGTGIGTGRGSAVGPGTGGGTQSNYPPTPTDIFLPPLPVPAAVKGFRLVAEFDVDETGRVLSTHFNPTPDRGYNRRLDEVLRGFRFRPGTKPDGTPIRMKAQVVVDLY